MYPESKITHAHKRRFPSDVPSHEADHAKSFKDLRGITRLENEPFCCWFTWCLGQSTNEICSSRHVLTVKGNHYKRDNVRITYQLQPLLQRKSNNYYIFCVCVRIPRYPACNSHASYFHLRPFPLYIICQHYLINGTIFGGKKGYWTWNVCFYFLYNFCLNHF